MSKVVKEIVTNPFTGEVSVEYSDGSTNKFNIADTAVATTDPITGGIEKAVAGTSSAAFLTSQKRVDLRQIAAIPDQQTAEAAAASVADFYIYGTVMD